MATPVYVLDPAADPNTVQLRHESFPHLMDAEWFAFDRMRRTIGDAGVISILTTTSAEDQKRAAVSFMDSEIANLRQATHRSPARISPLKIDVSKYHGAESEPLLRWFVELDASIQARQLDDESQRVAYAMSSLGGRAKSWAYGRRLSDPNCFSTID